MNGEALWGAVGVRGSGTDFATDNVEARVLRSRLVNLTLDWELTALTLDAQRYKATAGQEKENLRDSATAYRKCIAELTKVLSASSSLTCKT